MSETHGAGHAALALIESLIALLQDKGVLSAEDVDAILDGALDRVRAEQIGPADAEEALMRLRRSRPH